MTTAGPRNRARRPISLALGIWATTWGTGSAMAGTLGGRRERQRSGPSLSPASGREGDCVKHLKAAERGLAPRRRSRHLAAGLYHLSRPSWICLAAASGVSVALMTCAETFQSSFSRLGVPRDRIWYELRIVDLQELRQPTI